MRRRTSKKETEALLTLALIGGCVWVVWKFFETTGFMAPAIVVLVSVVVYAVILGARKASRRKKLTQKYDDAEIVSKIMSQSVWQQQTAEQLTDSLGKPVEIDQRVLKTKKKEIWKYNHRGANRFGLRITLENDLVVGWDNKN